MRLKEIKPGMVIHCKTEDEIRTLLQEAKSLGYTWASGQEINHEKDLFETICFYNADIAWTGRRDDEIEFSDLILPKLTAEEVLKVIYDICNTYSDCSYGCKKECPFFASNRYCKEWMAKHPEEVDEICAKWKSEHEKKEPEIETVDICRIIEIHTDGKKRCVHEIDLNPDGEMLFKEQIEEILKRYCMEHDGEFIAVHEVVYRVKK